MSQDHRPIETFLARLRGRLNSHRLWTTLIWTMAVAAGMLTLVGIWYTARGYAVPRYELALVPALAVFIGTLYWFLRRLDAEGAARAADQLFGLRDAMISYLHFSRDGRRNGFHELQAKQTRQRIEPLDPAAVPYEPPRRGIALAMGLLLVAVPLGLRGPSEARVEEQRLASETTLATATINAELEQLVEDLRDSALNAEEQELLDANKLRKWVDELKETADHKEALRQYAQLERKLNETRLSLQNKRDQQLLERAAREMETSRETQSLAEQLKQKNYDQSAELLKKMEPKAGDKSLSEQRKELARLKAAAQHMAAAAQASKSNSASSNPGASSSTSASSGSSSSQSKGSAAGAGQGQSAGGDMAQTMEDLAKAVAEFNESLLEAELQESQLGECKSDQLSKCQACSQCVSDEVDKLCKQLKKLGMCQRTDQRLASLCKACSQCQGSLSSLCMSPKAGGKKAGMGTNTARRDQIDELVDNGMTTQLKGIKGRGSSLTTVEAAEDGSGVSSRQATSNVKRTFKRQFEAFVTREDIPDEIREGVKQYFEVIHQIAPDATSRETTSNADHGT